MLRGRQTTTETSQTRTWAFYVHEIRVWVLYETLELVAFLFGFSRRVE